MKTVKTLPSLSDLTKQGTCIEFFSAYQEMDIERMMKLCTPDGDVYFEPLGEAGKGKIQEFGRTLWLTLMDCFPDLDNTVLFTQVNEDGSVTCSVKIFGTQEKDFAGVPAKGLRFDSDHIFIFRFTPDEKIDGISINWNHASFVRQLGS
jgi:hypothetical protein